jgi:hypothetical protein
MTGMAAEAIAAAIAAIAANFLTPPIRDLLFGLIGAGVTPQPFRLPSPIFLKSWRDSATQPSLTNMGASG